MHLGGSLVELSFICRFLLTENTTRPRPQNRYNLSLLWEINDKYQCMGEAVGLL